MQMRILATFLLIFMIQCSQKKNAEFCSVGGEELSPIVDSWSAIYQESGRKVPQHEARGNRTAAPALASRICNLAFVSDALPSEDLDLITRKLGRTPGAIPIAVEIIAFAVPKSFPVDSLSVEQIKSIFGSGEEDASALGLPPGKISAFGINSASDRYFWLKGALGIRAFSDRVKEMSGPLTLMDRVAVTSYGIGYGRPLEANGVKLLDISKDGRVLGIKSTDYPFRRYYFAYVTEKTPDTKAFLEFVLSDRGQKALLPSGLYPLPDSALIKAREELARQ